MEYLEKGAAVEVKLFRELQAPDLVVAGENSMILERLAESLPWRLMLLNTGSVRGRVYLEDGVADLAAVSSLDAAPVPEGMTVIKGYKRELGLIYRDAGAMSDPGSRIVGWHRDSMMKAAFERALAGPGPHQSQVRARGQDAFGRGCSRGLRPCGPGLWQRRQAAIEAGLGFKFLAEDEIQFLARPEIAEQSLAKVLYCALFRQE